MEEPLSRLRIAEGLGGQELDRDLAVQAQVFGQVHLAHAARSR